MADQAPAFSEALAKINELHHSHYKDYVQGIEKFVVALEKHYQELLKDQTRQITSGAPHLGQFVCQGCHEESLDGLELHCECPGIFCCYVCYESVERWRPTAQPRILQCEVCHLCIHLYAWDVFQTKPKPPC